MSTPTSPTVEAGQVWADNDARSAGRTLRVVYVGVTHAECVVITNSDHTDQQITRAAARAALGIATGYVPPDTRGKTSRIALSRFRPTSTGYRLDTAAEPCSHPNCAVHGKSPCEGVGCDGRDADDRGWM